MNNPGTVESIPDFPLQVDTGSECEAIYSDHDQDFEEKSDKDEDTESGSESDAGKKNTYSCATSFSVYRF